jgi:hypothetical protein
MPNYEQPDFLNVLDGDDSSNSSEQAEVQEEQKEKIEEEMQKPKLPKPDDGLDFDCEYCSDAPGGCPQCGYGKDR